MCVYIYIYTYTPTKVRPTYQRRKAGFAQGFAGFAQGSSLRSSGLPRQNVDPGLWFRAWGLGHWF